MTKGLKVIVIGGGGHAKVLIDMLQLNNAIILGYTDVQDQGEIFGINYLGEDSKIYTYNPKQIALVNGVGMLPGKKLRQNITNAFLEQGYIFNTVIHPSAIVSKHCLIDSGAQVMAGSVIQPSVSIGSSTIINTKSSIDHDCKVGANCHIAPGVTICGSVTIEDNVFIGAGATIFPNVTIRRNSIIRAGSVVKAEHMYL